MSIVQPSNKIVNARVHIFVVFGLSLGVLVPLASAQKPAPPPASGPPATSPIRPTNPGLLNSQPPGPEEDFVMFLTGEVATDDGARLPNNVMVERVCNDRVRQQVYADPAGTFSMQLGSVTDSALDASAEGNSQTALPGRYSDTGIPRQQLANCELRASASGFQSREVSLVALDSVGKNVEVGSIRIHRTAKVEGETLDAAAYKAPKDALTAYLKGLNAQRRGKLAKAQKYFERAVAVYPVYAHAWFQLGAILEKENEKDAARAAYIRATTVDARYPQPYLPLAVMASEEGNWREVIHLTDSILVYDSFKDLNGYTVELDPFDWGEAYFYNALANYNVKNFADAERNAAKAEHLLARSPELHLLLAQIFVRKNDYAAAIPELQTYLDLVPHANNVDQVRAWLAACKKRSSSLSTGAKNDPN
ncbi:MAG: tetratricopeptide repeat protein [Candidatus Acidiferrum sp.]